MAQCQKCKKEMKETMTDPTPTTFSKDGKAFYEMACNVH